MSCSILYHMSWPTVCAFDEVLQQSVVVNCWNGQPVNLSVPCASSCACMRCKNKESKIETYALV